MQRFLVIPNTTVHAHMAHLSTSLKPQIDALITRAEDLVEHEKDHVGSLEKRLAIMQSASVPVPLPLASNTDGQEHEEGQERGDGIDLECQLDDIDIRSLSVLQRRRIMLLRSKREKLERERIKYGLVDGEQGE